MYKYDAQYAVSKYLAEMHIPRDKVILHIARNVYFADCAQRGLVIVALSAHVARNMQNKLMLQARDLQAEFLQCCGGVGVKTCGHLQG